MILTKFKILQQPLINSMSVLKKEKVKFCKKKASKN